MKRLIILILSAILFTSTTAQTKQKKYLLQQIAALQVYISYVQKGYSIARQGLNTIGDIKHGEFNLHKDYFNSLKTVNPQIKKYSKVAEIVFLEVNIIKIYKEAAENLKQSGSLNSGEINYINGVFASLMDDCAKTIDALISVTTSGQLEMKDDERLKQIDALYSDMQDKYTFIQGFSNEARLLATSRISEQNNIRTSRALNGIKNR